MAVGTFWNPTASNELSLAESGPSWAIQKTSDPPFGNYVQQTGVSCATASACTAVGSYVDSQGAQVTLAEAWKGTNWTVEATPNPTGATASDLAGISCTAATTCTAVGSNRLPDLV